MIHCVHGSTIATKKYHFVYVGENSTSSDWESYLPGITQSLPSWYRIVLVVWLIIVYRFQTILERIILERSVGYNTFSITW